MGDPYHLYKYVIATRPIDEKFYPSKETNKEKRKQIDAYLEYVQLVLKRNNSWMLKLKV